jgi:hypothetical protein
MLGVFWSDDMQPINLGQMFNGVVSAVDVFTRLYVPPQRGQTVALLDNLDQVVLAYQHDGVGYRWYGCLEGFDALDFWYREAGDMAFLDVAGWAMQAESGWAVD